MDLGCSANLGLLIWFCCSAQVLRLSSCFGGGLCRSQTPRLELDVLLHRWFTSSFINTDTNNIATAVP